MSCPRPPSHFSVPGDAIASRRQLNTLAPRPRVPPEILVIVFFHVQEDEMPQYIEPSQLDPPGIVIPRRTTALGWIVVTHVCSYWRQVAIQACSLWSYVLLSGNSSWTQTILLRSRSVPLSIVLPTEGGGLDLDAIHVIQENVSRIQWLHISTDRVTMEILFSRLCVPAPLLKTVTFVCDVNDRPILSSIPSALFDGETFMVNSLSLVNCVTPWDSLDSCNLFRNLTSLNMSLPDNLSWLASDGYQVPIPRSKILPSLTQLLDLLRRSPRLEYLSLEEYLPKSTEKNHPHRDRDEVVFLPNLKVCHLVGDALDCAAVACHIYPSHSAFLGLGVFFGDDEQREAEFAAIAAVLEDHVSFGTQGPSTLSKAEIEMDLSWSRFSIHSSVCNVSAYTDWNSHRDTFTRRCLASLQLSEPITLLLRYSWSRAGAQPDLVHIFGTESLVSTTEVVLLRCHERGFQKFFDALCERSTLDVLSPDQIAHQSPVLIFPELRTLTLKDISSDDVGHGWVSTLRTAVAMRKEFGTPLEKLELHDCFGMDKALLEELLSIPGLQIVCVGDTQLCKHRVNSKDLFKSNLL